MHTGSGIDSELTIPTGGQERGAIVHPIKILAGLSFRPFKLTLLAYTNNAKKHKNVGPTDLDVKFQKLCRGHTCSPWTGRMKMQVRKNQVPGGGIIK